MNVKEKIRLKNERRKVYIKRYYQKNKKKILVKTDNKWTKCKCPMCGGEHKLKLFWTGKGTPRKYCEECKKLYVMNNSDMVIPNTLHCEY
jgi:hypothetical protein